MPELPEHSSPKAARILAAASELLLSRGSKGVTIAEVAAKAHVGKGTVYLYWKTKEDLLLGLISRDFLAFAEKITAAVTDDPELARPSRLCPYLLRTAAGHPFITALQIGDDELLGVLADDPRTASLLENLGPMAMMYKVVPIWRRNGLARTDWELSDQALALRALVNGFQAFSTSRLTKPLLTTDPERVLAASVTALLGPEHATPQQVQAAADEGIQSLVRASATAEDLIAQPSLTASIAP